MECLFILYVADQGRSSRFYRQLLQKEPVLEVPGMTEFELSSDTKLGLMPETGIAKIIGDQMPHPSLGNGVPRSELYLSVADAQEYYSRAVAAGAKEVSGLAARDWGESVAYVADPDGHILAFSQINRQE